MPPPDPSVERLDSRADSSLASALAAQKRGRVVSVCIPTLNEAQTIGPIVEVIRRELSDSTGLVDEILVMDDGSTDLTAERARQAGARVARASRVLAEHGSGPDKGRALWKSVFECLGDVIVFCDGDVHDFGSHFVTRMLYPILTDDRVAMVKGCYERPLDGVPGQGGRVTELTARPLLSLLFPYLAHVRQPLAGESASRREVLEELPFSAGYGVEIGLLIEVARRHGPDSLAQVDLGKRTHRNRSLEELGPQALAVLDVALRKCGLTQDRDEPPSLLRPGRDPVRVDTVELPALKGLREYQARRANSRASHTS